MVETMLTDRPFIRIRNIKGPTLWIPKKKNSSFDMVFILQRAVFYWNLTSSSILQLSDSDLTFVFYFEKWPNLSITAIF